MAKRRNWRNLVLFQVKSPDSRVMGDHDETLSIWGHGYYHPNTAIARGSFSLHPKVRPTFMVTVTASCITCVPEDLSSHERDRQTIQYGFRDIVGCDCLKGKTEVDGSAYVVLYTYPHRKKLMGKKTSRRRETLTLTFDQKPTYAENQEAANRWRLMLQAILEGLHIRDLSDLSRMELAKPKRMLVLVNPCSGPGKALSIFQERVVPLFAEAGIHFNLVVTEYAGHARKVVKNLVLSSWYGIVIVSGDGLVYEVINGLAERDDWEEALKTPISALPGGSGNALACALNFYAGEPVMDNPILHSAYLVAKHTVMPMDLVAVDTINERIYSFLSVTWAIIADVDIESERYRSLGNARFTVYGLTRIVNMRVYPGRLSFLPVEPYVPPKDINSTYRRRGGMTRSQSEYLSGAGDGPEARPGPRSQPPRSQSVYDVQQILREQQQLRNGSPSGSSPEEDLGALDGVYRNGGLGDGMYAGESREDLERVMVNGHGENGRLNPPMDTVHNHASRRHSRGDSRERSPPHIPTPLLAPLNEPVPSDWVTIEDDFVLFMATYQSHLSHDFCAHPESTIDDGLIYLAFVRNSPSGARKRVLSMFTKMHNGGHVGLPGYEMVKVKAFRLEPLSDTGTICVDGELVDHGPIQAQVLPGAARVMARPKY